MTPLEKTHVVVEVSTTPQDSVQSSAQETIVRTNADTAPDTPALPSFEAPFIDGELGRLGKYRIQKELGRGGMGAVYLAFDERLQRKVALKVMLPQAAANSLAKERFLREARAAAQIDSDHVVNIFEADEIQNTPYIALQYLQGSPLDEYLKKKGNPSLTQIMRIGRETSLGLAAAHQLGIVHRDIKPANLWLEAPQGRVKILDFGLAKPVVGADGAEMTASGVVMGTPAYMAPEQGRGQAVDGRADLFSLGCVLYRLCTGRLPFDRPTLMAILIATGSEEATPVRELNPDVPVDLAGLIARLMAKNPAHRPQSALAVAEEFNVMKTRALDSSPVSINTPIQPYIVYLPMSESATSSSPFADITYPDEPTTQTVLISSPKKAKTFPSLLVGSVLFALVAFAVAGVVIIKITNKDGSVTEIKVPDGAKIEVDGKLVGPKKPEPKVVTEPKSVASGKGVYVKSLTADAPPLGLDTNKPFTVEMVVTPLLKDAETCDFVVVGLDKGFGIRLKAGKFIFYTYHNLDSGGAVKIGKRTHLAGVRTETERILYVDGKVVSRTAEPLRDKPAILTDTKLSVGQFTNADVDALVEEFRISQTARYSKDFTPAARHETDKDTLALYHCDEGDGAVLKDTSGNKRDIKLKDAKWAKADAERLAAEYVLSIGGVVRVNGYDQEYRAVTDLPKEAFALTGVNLDENKLITDADLVRFKSLKNLLELQLGNTNVTDAGMVNFADCKKLTKLDLHLTQVGDVGFVHFQDCKNLKQLTVTASKITDAGLAYFKNCVGLTHLYMGSGLVTDAGLAHFNDCRNLMVMYVNGTQITDKGFTLFKDCEQLQMLYLDNTGVGDESVAQILKFKKLTTLWFKKTKISAAKFEELKIAFPKCKIESDHGTHVPK